MIGLFCVIGVWAQASSDKVEAANGTCESTLQQRPEIQIEYIGQPGAKRIFYYFRGARQDFSWQTSELRKIILNKTATNQQKDIAFATISFGPFWVLTDQAEPIMPEAMIPVQQFVSLMDELEKQNGFDVQERYSLGHSLGSINSLLVELAQPGMFKRMAFTGPAFFSYDPTRISMSATVKIARALWAIEEESFGFKLKSTFREAFLAPATYSLFTGRINTLDKWMAIKQFLTAPSNWHKTSPQVRIQNRIESGQGFPDLFFICGQKDINFLSGVRQFCLNMNQQGTKVQSEFPEGIGHMGPFDEEAIAQFLLVGTAKTE